MGKCKPLTGGVRAGCRGRGQLELEEVKEELKKLEPELRKLKEELAQTEQVLKGDFGKQGEFLALYHKCFSQNVQQFTYELCLFQKATQKEDRSENKLGSVACAAPPSCCVLRPVRRCRVCLESRRRAVRIRVRHARSAAGGACAALAEGRRGGDGPRGGRTWGEWNKEGEPYSEMLWVPPRRARGERGPRKADAGGGAGTRRGARAGRGRRGRCAWRWCAAPTSSSSRSRSRPSASTPWSS